MSFLRIRSPRCPVWPSLCLLAAVLLAGPDALAQPAGPFATLEVAAGGSTDVARSLVDTYWEQGYGAELSVTTPFYAGTAELGGALHRFDARTADVPRFDAVAVFAGWGVELHPVRWAGWYNGVRIGNYRMSFDDDTFAGVRNESELLVGLHSRIDLELGGWTVFGGVTLQQVYTFIRMRSVHVGGGLRYRMRAPGWLQEVLR